jgi:hypothetical protein
MHHDAQGRLGHGGRCRNRKAGSTSGSKHGFSKHFHFFTSIVVSKPRIRRSDLDPFAHRTQQVETRDRYPRSARPIPANNRARLTQYPQPAKAGIAFAAPDRGWPPAAKSPSQKRARNPGQAIAPGNARPASRAFPQVRPAKSPLWRSLLITPITPHYPADSIDTRDPAFPARITPRRVFALQFLRGSFS